MMTVDQHNTIFDLAFSFVAHTRASLFLTGKAGTGKTTFLKHVCEAVSKHKMVVAPTGVAAINAGGVTLHSFFQLPLGLYIPHLTQGFGGNEKVFNRHQLLKNIRLNGQKRALMKQLELLIVDEVSMLRCDMLDAMDEILRHVRRRNEPFGGVQVLFIGDLQQLPPVVSQDEKELMDTHYDSPFFFDAKVLQQYPPVFIELKKIYRQQDQTFIDLLNRVRNNNLTQDDFALLNSRYEPNFDANREGVITLTSHNNKALQINEKALASLQEKEHVLTGSVTGDFPERIWPTDLHLRLKVGAQVMFIKNDTSIEKRWYNGKIVHIESINEEGITVANESGSWREVVGMETWQQIRYEIDEQDGKITEKVIGEFTQYPLKLAWAITIHKSQGLTFERVVLDAGDSFAAGQVYVALSRCTTLEGLTLKSYIGSNAIHTDSRIHRFHLREMSLDELQALLVQARREAQIEQANRLFSCSELLEDAELLLAATELELPWDNHEALETFKTKWLSVLDDLQETAMKFRMQRDRLVVDYQVRGNSEPLIDRIQKGLVYFSRIIFNDILIPLLEFNEAIPTKKVFLDLRNAVFAFRLIGQQVLQAFANYTWDGERLWPADIPLFDLREYITKAPIKPAPKAKAKKGETVKESLVYFQSGKTIAEIAELRNLAESTIASHLTKAVELGELAISAILNESQIEEIKRAVKVHPDLTIKELSEKLDHQYPYAFVKLVINLTGEQAVATGN